MTFKELQAAMIAAMKAKEKERKDVISATIAAVKKVAIDEGCREDIPDEMVERVILKEMKTAQEQVDTCPDDRTELKAEYQRKLDIIKEFAPKMMEEDEIRDLLTTKFSDVIATKNKGMIMKAVMAELKGKADGKTINKVVAELCG